MENIKHVFKGHAYQNVPLTFDEAYELAVYALTGCNGDRLAQVQSIAALCALHTRATYKWEYDRRVEKMHEHRIPRSAAEQIAGICKAIFDHDIAKSEFGFLNPNVPFAMDNCGMGGDLVVTANVSTVAGFIAAAAGIPMCKHGSPANADQGKYGSSDFVGAICKIDNFAHKEAVESCLEVANFAYTDACDTRYKRIHMQTHDIAMLPHMNDIIGPITNPLDPALMKYRVLGINHLIPTEVVAEVYKILNERGTTQLRRGLFVRGFSDASLLYGMDEVSICSGGTQVTEFLNGDFVTYFLYADNFGLDPVHWKEIMPRGNKGEFSYAILMEEEQGAAKRMVLANAAILLYLNDRQDQGGLSEEAPDLREYYSQAKELLESGAAYRQMMKVRELLPLS